MSYQDIANMAEDWPLRMRMIACAAEVHPDDPMAFVEAQIWRITGQPGWAAAWAAAKKGDDDYEPGADEAVITDQMIFDGIQQLSGAVRGRDMDEGFRAESAMAAQLQAEADRQLDIFAKQRELEIANPIVEPAPPVAAQLPYVEPEPEPPVETLLHPDDPPPASTPFQEPSSG